MNTVSKHHINMYNTELACTRKNMHIKSNMRTCILANIHAHAFIQHAFKQA